MLIFLHRIKKSRGTLKVGSCRNVGANSKWEAARMQGHTQSGKLPECRGTLKVGSCPNAGAHSKWEAAGMQPFPQTEIKKKTNFLDVVM
jgi:hypothetical protein